MQRNLDINKMDVTPSEVEMAVSAIMTVRFVEAESIWRKAFDTLRAFEKEVIHNKELIEFFVYEIRKFNGCLQYVNAEKPNLIGYTRYWILNTPLKRDIQLLYHLKDGIIMRDGHISYFLTEDPYLEEDGNFFYSEEEYRQYLYQTDV